MNSCCKPELKPKNEVTFYGAFGGNAESLEEHDYLLFEVVEGDEGRHYKVRFEVSVTLCQDCDMI